MLFFGWFKKKKKTEEPKPVEPKPVEKEEPVEEVIEAQPTEEVAEEETVAPTPEVEVEEELSAEEPEPVEEDVPAEEEKPEVDVASLTVKELKDLAKEKGLTGYSGLKKAELIDLLK